jgi:hypothetical protein
MYEHNRSLIGHIHIPQFHVGARTDSDMTKVNASNIYSRTSLRASLCTRYNNARNCECLATSKTRNALRSHSIQSDDLAVDARGFVKCPDCQTSVHLGTVGIQNLYKRHKGSMKCKENKLKHESRQALQKSQAAARKFFAPRAPNVPPTVTEPPRVQATPSRIEVHRQIFKPRVHL